jgi:hypothetical protein
VLSAVESRLSIVSFTALRLSVGDITMADSLPPTLFHKLRYTPMCDVIRGRFTARLDVRSRVNSTDLPQPAKDLIRRVVRRTWLHRFEKIDVADELIAHFADGLAAGTTGEHLIDSFGDERSAARLIARAKRRNRSIAARLFVLVKRVWLAVIVFYASLAIHFYAGKPSNSVNYLTVMNRDVERVPPEQRAWPIYEQIHRDLGPRPGEAENKICDCTDLLSAKPTDARWPQLLQWLDQRQPLLDSAYQASQKPSLGLVLRISPTASRGHQSLLY